jgi:hypothetical protein
VKLLERKLRFDYLKALIIDGVVIPMLPNGSLSGLNSPSSPSPFINSVRNSIGLPSTNVFNLFDKVANSVSLMVMGLSRAVFILTILIIFFIMAVSYIEISD